MVKSIGRTLPAVPAMPNPVITTQCRPTHPGQHPLSTLDVTKAMMCSMTQDAIQLPWPDAWVFMAIGGRGEHSALSFVVSSLDYLNRAMPSEAEFEVSVNRLGKAGLVDVAVDGFAVTEAGRSILEGFGAGHVGVIKMMFDIRDAWQNQRFPVANPGFVMKMHPGDWEIAQREAHARFLGWKAKHQPL